MVVIHRSGFEPGDFSEWTSTGGSLPPTVISTRPHHGKYVMEWRVNAGVLSDGWCRKRFTEIPAIFVRGLFRLGNLPETDTRYTMIVVRNDLVADSSIAKVYIDNTSDVNTWRLMIKENGVETFYSGPAVGYRAPQHEKYYTLGLYVKIHASLGEAALFINGVKSASTTGKKTDNQGNIDVCYIGEYDANFSLGFTARADDIIIADNNYVDEERWQFRRGGRLVQYGRQRGESRGV